jgi:hypothetical protein
MVITEIDDEEAGQVSGETVGGEEAQYQAQSPSEQPPTPRPEKTKDTTA